MVEKQKVSLYVKSYESPVIGKASERKAGAAQVELFIYVSWVKTSVFRIKPFPEDS